MADEALGYTKLKAELSCFRNAKQTDKLIYGYIREIQKLLSQIVPSEINQICIAFILQKNSTHFTIYDKSHAQIQTINDSKHLLSITNEMVDISASHQKCNICRESVYDEPIYCEGKCFRLIHKDCIKTGSTQSIDNWYCKQCIMLKDNKFQSLQILKGDDKSEYLSTTDIVFLSDTAIISGIHELTFQCIKKHSNDKIGIISEADLDKLKGNGIGSNSLYRDTFGEYRYFWWCHTQSARLFEKGAKDRKIRLRQDGDDTSVTWWWRVGNYIGIIIDCDKWTIQFKLNDCKSQIINIKPDIKYYAVLAIGGVSTMYLYDMS